MTSRIEQQVMAGVGIVYAAHLLLSRAALELYALALSAVALWQLVWVHKVFENFFTAEHAGLGALGNYLFVAVEHTQLAVQVTLLVAVVALIGLIVDTMQSFRHHAIMA